MRLATFTRAYTKYEVTCMLKVTSQTLAYWLNIKYYSDLKKLGYIKDEKILNPKILNYLRDKIDLQPPDTHKIL